MRISDWSSDVCSSYLLRGRRAQAGRGVSRDLLPALQRQAGLLPRRLRRRRRAPCSRPGPVARRVGIAARALRARLRRLRRPALVAAGLRPDVPRRGLRRRSGGARATPGPAAAHRRRPRRPARGHRRSRPLHLRAPRRRRRSPGHRSPGPRRHGRSPVPPRPSGGVRATVVLIVLAGEPRTPPNLRTTVAETTTERRKFETPDEPANDSRRNDDAVTQVREPWQTCERKSARRRRRVAGSRTTYLRTTVAETTTESRKFETPDEPANDSRRNDDGESQVRVTTESRRYA